MPPSHLIPRSFGVNLRAYVSPLFQLILLFRVLVCNTSYCLSPFWNFIVDLIIINLNTTSTLTTPNK